MIGEEILSIVTVLGLSISALAVAYTIASIMDFDF